MKSLKDQFADWVRTKPADEEYSYVNPMGCALFQFLTENGYPVDSVGPCGLWFDTDDAEHATDGIWPAIAGLPETFGSLAQRLEA